MLSLGGNIDPPVTGKFLDKNHICLKRTNQENLYPIDLETNMLVRRNHDEYPQYIKNETGDLKFTRQINT